MSEPLPLGYTPQWIELGIVSLDDIQRDEREVLAGDDPHPEHYRWRAFSRFLAEQSTLASPVASQLYALGSTDADVAMGGSIMVAVINHLECPVDVLRLALASGHGHLQRIAAQRLESRSEK